MCLLVRCLMFAGVLFFVDAVAARPVEQPEGFAAMTPGGRGAQVLLVRSLDDSGEGSLRWALSVEGKREVRFAVEGTIHLKSPLVLRKEHSFLTVSGADAPGKGVQVVGSELVLTAAIHDVQLRHLRWRCGAELDRPWDCIKIYAPKAADTVARVHVANCSLQFAPDECVSINGFAEDITFSDCLFKGMVFKSGKKIEGSRGALFLGPANSQKRICLLRSAFVSTSERQPQIKVPGGEFVILNSAISNFTNHGVNLFEAGKVDLIGNVVVPGPLSKRQHFGVRVRSEEISIYSHDNQLPQKAKLENTRSKGIDWPETARAPKLLASRDLIQALTPTLGATLPQRDAIDKKIIEELQQNSGRVVGNQASLEHFEGADWLEELPSDWSQ